MTVVPAGAIVLCSSTGSGWVSRLISWATSSPFSHAQLVTKRGHAEALSYSVLEVGWTIREERAETLGDRGAVILWPRLADGELAPPELGQEVATRVLRLLEGLDSRRYPWFKLPAYLLPRRLRERVLIGGPRQVCSVWAIRPWVDAGAPVFVYGRHRQRIDTPSEVRGITPADLEDTAARRRWMVVYRSPGAPFLR